MFTTSAPRITVRFVALLTAVSLVLSAFPAAFFVANAEEPVPPAEIAPAIAAPVEEAKITVCHAAGQSGNYTATEVAISAVIEGHGDHEGDIIPPFGDFAGQNWNDDTEAIWNNECAPVVIVPPNEACEIEGHKYNESGSPLAGWTMGLMKVITHNLGVDQYDLATAETDDDGYYCLEWDGESRELRPNTISTYVDGAYTFVYRVFEEIKEGWNNISIEKGPSAFDLSVADESEVLTDDTRTSVQIGEEGDYVYANAEYHVDFYNKEKSNEEPEDTHQITGIKWNDENGNGVREEGEEGLAGWTIVAENDEDESSVSTTTDATGHYTLLVPDGEWTVREVQQQGWEQTSIRQNGDDMSETVNCSFYFSDEPIVFKSLTSKLLDPEVIDYENTCDFGNHYFYETITACKLTEDKQPVAGWTMAVTNLDSEDEDYVEITTGEDGCASVDLDPDYGPWIVVEETKEGWSQVDVLANNGDVLVNEGDSVEFCIFFDYRAEARTLDSSESEGDMDPSYTCTFINNAPDVIEEPEQPTRGGSTGTRTKRAPRGQVLGATTQCGLWLNDYMQKATKNDTYQVLKLQVFLTLQGYATPLTGIFDDTTEANVKLFQAKYADTVIKPWFEKGIVPHNRPTGFVYKTTRWQINDIMCPGIEAFPSLEGENLSTNVLIKG